MTERQNKIKRIRIIAGPNGSGKTTLYYLLKDLLFTGVWVNADEILATINKTGVLDSQQMGFTPELKNFKTYLYFIATIDPQINKMRIATRIKKGGHFVSEKKLVARFSRSISLLKKNISLFDRIFVLDNSKSSMRLIVSFVLGKPEKIYDKDIPSWVQN